MKKIRLIVSFLAILIITLLLTVCSVPQGGSSGGGGGGGNTYPTYTLTINVIGNGTVTPNTGTYTYISGTVVNLTADCTGDNVFIQWRGDLKSVNLSENITMHSDKTIEAYFVNTLTTDKHSLTVNATNGSVAKFPDPDGDGKYYDGTIVYLTADPDYHYKFTTWSGDVNGANNPANLTINAPDKTVTANFTDLVWNIMIYMAADNDLEPYAMLDLNELENISGLDTSNINVFVLVDRINGYSTDDGDWKGTRLYQITYDPITTDNNIRSNRLTIMGLSDIGDADELNMADPMFLSNFVYTVQLFYPAPNSMLILWNHGNGWRNKMSDSDILKVAKPDTFELLKNTLKFDKTSKDKKTSIPINTDESTITIDNFILNSNDPTKSICLDVTSSNDILNNSEVRTALTGRGLTVLGFDACLMGMIESIYEFKDLASYMIASPESIPGTGWDYDGWLTSFLSTGLSVTDLYTTAIDSYETYYSSTQTACLAAYDLSLADNLYSEYSNFTSDLNSYLWNASHTNRSDDIFDIILNNTEQYVTPVAGGNFHIDIYDLANNFSSLSGSSTLKTAIDNIVVDSWTQPVGTIFTGNPRSHGIAAYFGTLDGSLNIRLLNDYIIGDYTLFTTNSNYPDFLLDLYQFPRAYYGTWASATTYNDPSIAQGSSEYYFIYVNNLGTVSATLNNYGSNDLDLYLGNYNTRTLLNYSWYGDPTEYVSYSFSSSQKGWYVIEVNHYTGSTTSYRLNISGSNIF